AAAIALSSYFLPAIVPGSLTDDLPFLKILFSCLAVVALTLVHHAPIHWSARFQNVLVILKMILIFSLGVAGFLIGSAQGVSFLPSSQTLSGVFSSSFAVSLVFVMYAYSGWNAVIYIADEVENHKRNLPLAMFIGTATVTLL